jgi:hypothetical protein
MISKHDIDIFKAIGLNVTVIDENTQFPPPQGDEKWFVTFGFGTPYAHQYAKLESVGYEAARAEAFERFGRNWAFLYPQNELQDQIKAYGLTERTE